VRGKPGSFLAATVTGSSIGRLWTMLQDLDMGAGLVSSLNPREARCKHSDVQVVDINTITQDGGSTTFQATTGGDYLAT